MRKAAYCRPCAHAKVSVLSSERRCYPDGPIRRLQGLRGILLVRGDDQMYTVVHQQAGNHAAHGVHEE